MSGPFPSTVEPGYGVFVKERARAVADLPDYEVRVVSPIPYFPPLKLLKQWYHWSQFPYEEAIAGLRVARPRFALPPKIGGYFQPRLMEPFVRRCIDRIRREFPFDLIDSHWVFPYGVLAMSLGRRYGTPVVMTGRGEDMRCFPEYPVIGPQIRRALRSHAQFIAVSREIGELMRAQGADPDRVTVIPNGIDCAKFTPVDQAEARRRLGLPSEGPLVVSVGECLELKGFHILVDAISELSDRWPNLQAVIVGRPGRFGRDFTGVIKQRIAQHRLEERVRLVGGRPHEELRLWYSAADVFALLSSREGSPNVLLEALACGTPAVATGVGGILEVLAAPHLGLVLPERTAAATADGLNRALTRHWDRAAIRHTMEEQSWQRTAESVSGVFDRAVAAHSAHGS
ncbi:MAG: glycosyltransferase [Planctomycetaceae bacterium]|nr:glycosyltransferase [Planctomycetaceae bacterium]